MAFSFTDEQASFRDVVRRFCDARSPSTEVRRLMQTDSGYDQAVWRQMNDELGLAGLPIAEAFGGAGFGAVELGIVVEEMGRALLCSPYFSSVVLAAGAIAESGDEGASARWLPAIASGSSIATLAFAEADGRWDVDAIATTAEAGSGGQYRLRGTKRFVTDGTIADLIVVAARAPGSHGDDGVSLYAVPANADGRDADGLQRRALEPLDPTRKLAELTFNDTPATPVGEPGAGADALRRALRHGAVALANENVGGAQRLFDSALAYTLMRVQFGRLIGSFQAIKHQCAELLLDLELAKSAAYQAASAEAEGDAELPALAALAKAGTSDSYMRIAASCIQLHGGIGFTWEHDTHLWYKRAKSAEVFLGTPAWHREQMMRHWAGAPAVEEVSR